MLEQLRAHHRRKRQRDEARHDDRAGERPGKLGEEPPGKAGHEANRRVDGRERDRHGDDGEADLPAAEERGLDRAHALLDVAVDVLEHDDGVVDHEADGEHEREQGQGVDGEAEGIHQRERADQRYGNRDEGNQRRPDRAQEQEDDENDEDHRLADRRVDVLDRLGDEERLVVRHANLHAVRQPLDDARQDLVDRLGDLERVRRRLLDDADGDGGLAVEADHATLVERSEFGHADVAQAHEIAVGVLDDEVVELLGRAEVRLGQHGELALEALDAARWHLNILAPQRVLDVLRRELVGGQPFGIEPDAHGIGAVAV